MQASEKLVLVCHEGTTYCARATQQLYNLGGKKEESVVCNTISTPFRRLPHGGIRILTSFIQVVELSQLAILSLV